MPIRLALALIVPLLATFPALASTGCLTHSEAKHMYGRETYLHWTGQHCWGIHHAQARRSKESAPVLTVSQHAEHGPNSDAARTGADTVWPSPPSDFTWADRWPDERRMAPGRWLFDLRQFGGGR